MAVFGSGGNPRVMDAAMRQTRLYRPKWDEIHDGDGSTYGQLTISRAIAASPWANRSCLVPHTTHDSIQALIDAGNRPLTSQESGRNEAAQSPTVFIWDIFSSGGVKNRVIPAVLAFLLGVQESGPKSSYSRSENWVRVPVLGLAELLKVNRKEISRALTKLDHAGAIERQTVTARVNGQPRKDSLVRFVGLEVPL